MILKVIVTKEYKYTNINVQMYKKRETLLVKDINVNC